MYNLLITYILGINYFKAIWYPLKSALQFLCPQRKIIDLEQLLFPLQNKVESGNNEW